MQYSTPNGQWEGAKSGSKPGLGYWKTRMATLVSVYRRRLFWLPSAAPLSCPLVLPPGRANRVTRGWTKRVCRSRAKQHCAIRYYDIVALPGIMSSLKLDCLHIDNICKMFQCQKKQAFKICADAPGLSGLAPGLFWAGFSSRRMGRQHPGSAQDHPGSRDPHPRRASVKRRSPQTRSGVRPGQIVVFLASKEDRVQY